MFPIAELTKLDEVFPASVLGIMPKEKDIPEDFPMREKWEKLFNDWFYLGLRNLSLLEREGVDKDKAIRHIRSIMGSYQPKHEHKEAAVAFLLSEWFSDGDWEVAQKASDLLK